MKLNIQEMIQAVIAKHIAAALAGMTAEQTETVADTRMVKAETVVESLRFPARPEPSKAPRHRARGSHVHFACQWNGKAPLDIIPTAMETLEAIVGIAKKGKPATYAAIIAATGRSENSIQSAVWWLRNHDANGVRQDKELVRTGKARKALIRTVTP